MFFIFSILVPRVEIMKYSHCIRKLVHSVSFSASRIRGRVARTPFDEFHRYSARIVKEAIFGVDKDGNIRPSLLFKEHNMVCLLLKFVLIFDYVSHCSCKDATFSFRNVYVDISVSVILEENNLDISR